MKIISFGMGQKIFEENSKVRERQIEYGKYFDQVHLIVFSPNDSRFENKKLSENIFLYPTKSSIRILYIFDFLRLTRNILKKSKDKDFIITCQDPFEIGIVGVLVKLFFGLPLHIQVHTDFNNKYFIFHSVSNIFRFLIAHIVLPYADKVRCVSKRIEKSIKSLNNNISVLPIFSNFKIKELPDKDFKGRIITISRLEKEKNIETAILAFSRLATVFKDATFTIVGDGSQKSKLEALVKNLKLDKKVFFEGWQNDTGKYFENADIYISTSLFEGYGISVVEAAISGLPLVISDAGIANEYFGNTEAFILDPKNIDGFYNGLISLFNNSDLREKISNQVREIVSSKIIDNESYLRLYSDDIKETPNGFIRKTFYKNLFDFLLSIVDGNKVLRFVIAGGSVALTQIFILYVLTDIFGFWYLLSSIFSFIFAVISSFLLQKFWAFRDRTKEKAFSQFLKFILVAIIGIIVNTLSMYFWVDFIGIYYILSQFITGFIIMIINFLIYKFFIFKNEASFNYTKGR